MTRGADLGRFYKAMADLKQRVGDYRYLSDCTGHMNWPDRGIYVFFAADETRGDSEQPRVTRIGTHAVAETSGTKLWTRLRNHRGTFSGGHVDGGNHRGSVFRLRVGEALIAQEGLDSEYPYWGVGSSEPADGVRDEEYPMEKRVSEYIRDLPFLWLAVDDEPGPGSNRAYLERNAIALLSNFRGDPIDPREDWLGNHSSSAKIATSGLWNVNHVDETHDPLFLDLLETYVHRMS